MKLIIVCCQDEECPEFRKPKNFASSKDSDVMSCPHCTKPLVPCDQIPDPDKKSYSLKKDMTSPTGQFNRSTSKNVEEWAKALKISKEEFKKKIKEGDYNEWFE